MVVLLLKNVILIVEVLSKLFILFLKFLHEFQLILHPLFQFRLDLFPEIRLQLTVIRFSFLHENVVLLDLVKAISFNILNSILIHDNFLIQPIDRLL